MDTATKRVILDALKHVLGEAEDNLYRWKLQNRNPEYRDEKSEAIWQSKVDETKAAIQVVEGSK